MDYYFTTTVNKPFDDSIKDVIEELKKEGFGVLTEINVKETLKKKLDVDFRKYIILGACNPPFAYKALNIEDKIGTMLPCNIILQELEINKTEISAIDPFAAMNIINKPELSKIAEEVGLKLKKVINSL